KVEGENRFATRRERMKGNQFGATLGGPLTVPGLYNGTDHAFFFASYEGTRERQGLVFNSLVPTSAMKRGDFSAAGLPVIYDPLTTRANPSGGGTIRTAFPGNVIPLNRLSPQALFFTQFIPDPNTASGTASFTTTLAL